MALTMKVGLLIELRSVRRFKLPRVLSSFRSAVEVPLLQGVIPGEPGAEGLTEPCGRGDIGVPAVLTGRVAVMG